MTGRHLVAVDGFETPGQILGRLAWEYGMETTPDTVKRPATWAGLDRTFLLSALAVAGVIVCGIQILENYRSGGWPYYDTACYWLGGLHLRTGEPVYGSTFPFRYAPPLAILSVPLSFLPLELVAAGLFVLQVLAYRYICGSWRTAGLVAWLPIVPRELVTGNVDMLMAAAMLAPMLGVRRSGWTLALAALAKWSPAFILVSARRWREFALALVVLCALTLPVLHLWPEWWAYLFNPPEVWIPLAVRVPIGLVLVAYRRPWSVLAGAAILTPAFYFHSLVLLIPAFRLRELDRRQDAAE
jgi:hypothetical protein